MTDLGWLFGPPILIDIPVIEDRDDLWAITAFGGVLIVNSMRRYED